MSETSLDNLGEAKPLDVIIVTGDLDSRKMLDLAPESSPWSTEKISLDFKETQNEDTWGFVGIEIEFETL